jgi:hypothetical protein
MLTSALIASVLLTAPAPVPAVACTYSITSPGDASPRVLSTWRDADRIEIHDAAAARSDAWLRDEAGRLTWVRAFHDRRRAVEHGPALLEDLPGVPAWETLSAWLDPAVLGSLDRSPRAVKALGMSAVLHRGRISGEPVEIVWIPELGLPARVSRGPRGSRHVLTLLQVHAKDDAPPPPDWSAYELLDAADAGDREGDPSFRELMPAFAHGREHAH